MSGKFIWGEGDLHYVPRCDVCGEDLTEEMKKLSETFAATVKCPCCGKRMSAEELDEKTQ